MLSLDSDQAFDLQCTLLVFSSNCPVSKNLSNEVGMKYRILLLILVKMELFKSHFWPLGSKMQLWYCLEVKSDIGKSQKNWNLSRRCQKEGVIYLLKNHFFPKSKALEFNDGINQSYHFRFQKFRLVFSFRSNPEMFHFDPWSIRFFKFS